MIKTGKFLSSSRVNDLVKNLADELETTRPLTFLNRTDIPCGVPLLEESAQVEIKDFTVIDWLNNLWWY